MGRGYLKVKVTTGDGALPIARAHVTIKGLDGVSLYQTDTNANGNTGTFSLPAPDKEYTLDPNYSAPAYSQFDVEISAGGFMTEHIHGVEIVDTQTAILPVNMAPLVDEPDPDTEHHIYIPQIGLLLSEPYLKVNQTSSLLRPVIIPEYITVHLGSPADTSAMNVRVKFVDYIKNVTSSEIYSTWPNNSIVANTHAIVTFALNRVYTEWYPSRGLNFDITNTTSYDQYFRYGAQIYENISRIVDDIFNVYAHRFGFVNPFFTQFCNGTTVTCNGLSQWGTVYLAELGYPPIEILRYYYTGDLQLTASENIAEIAESYPGYPLSLGSTGEDVLRKQTQLNRIRANFPIIPPISNPDGYFGTDTQAAVRAFQQTFDLVVDGIIGKQTWNKITSVFVGVTRLAELDSEGIRYTIGTNPPNVVLSRGSQGENVLELQFILNSISPYYPTVPTVIMDGIFDARVENAVMEFQKTFGLSQDGIVGPTTWNKLYAVYHGIRENAPLPAN